MLEGRKKVLFCRVDPEFHEKIKIEANKNKIKMSEQIRRMLANQLTGNAPIKSSRLNDLNQMVDNMISRDWTR
jgi:hypothetical protein